MISQEITRPNHTTNNKDSEMKIRVLRNLGRGLPDYHEGQEVEVKEAVGEELARQGLAVILSAPAPKKRKRQTKPEAEQSKPADPPESPKQSPPAAKK